MVIMDLFWFCKQWSVLIIVKLWLSPPNISCCPATVSRVTPAVCQIGRDLSRLWQLTPQEGKKVKRRKAGRPAEWLCFAYTSKEERVILRTMALWPWISHSTPLSLTQSPFVLGEYRAKLSLRFHLALIFYKYVCMYTYANTPHMDVQALRHKTMRLILKTIFHYFCSHMWVALNQL